MFNRIGKNLVLVHTTFSLLALGYALAVYLKFTDLGWKEPFKVWETKDSGYRIPSDLDKRTAALYDLYRTRERATPGIQPPLDVLAETMDRFPKNHLFYVDELNKLQKSTDPIQPKALKWDKGNLVLDTPGKSIGKPVLEAPIPGIDKSLTTVQQELKKIQGDVETITPEIHKLVEQADAITIELYGTKDDKGNTDVIGLYEILEKEREHQDKIAAEKEYITPVYVDAERRLQGFLDRYKSMERSLQAAQNKK